MTDQIERVARAIDAGAWAGDTQDHLFARAHAICAAHRAIAAASEWLPIESAPMDGTWILLSGVCTRTKAPALVCQSFGGDWISADDGYDAYFEPTHWQPLPQPPKVTP